MNTASRLYEARSLLGNFAACFTASVRGRVEPSRAGEVGQQVFVQLDTSCDCGTREIKRQCKQLPTGLRLQRKDGEGRAGLRSHEGHCTAAGFQLLTRFTKFSHRCRKLAGI